MDPLHASMRTERDASSRIIVFNTGPMAHAELTSSYLPTAVTLFSAFEKTGA